MRNFFSSKFLIVILLIVSICLGMAVYTGASGKASPLTKLVGIVVSPFQQGVSKVVGKINDSYDYAFQYDQMKQENETLKKQVRDMEQKVRDADVAIQENDRLRLLLGIKERNRSFQFEVAEVIAHTPTDWATTLTIDKGSKVGIEEGDCVITEDGMVGYVSMVAPTYSEVVSVIDMEMQAGALITRTRVIAIAEGDYALMADGCLKLSYLDTDADIVIGDTIETSGRGGVFPKGIMIGTVESIVPEEHGISNYAVVKPFVDMESVHGVFVIKDFEVTE